MTRRNRMKKLSGLVGDYRTSSLLLPAGVYEFSVTLYRQPHNYRKHIQQLKALRGRR